MRGEAFVGLPILPIRLLSGLSIDSSIVSHEFARERERKGVSFVTHNRSFFLYEQGIDEKHMELETENHTLSFFAKCLNEYEGGIYPPPSTLFKLTSACHIRGLTDLFNQR